MMSIGLVGMSLCFAVAGVLQAYLERYLGQPYIISQQPIRFWMLPAAALQAGEVAAKRGSADSTLK